MLFSLFTGFNPRNFFHSVKNIVYTIAHYDYTVAHYDYTVAHYDYTVAHYEGLHNCTLRGITQLHITRDYNHRRPSDRIWAQDGRLFRQNIVIFLYFSLVMMNFFSPI